uniref:Mei2-like C-terminal RNA recognition motif domain-containing protein n=1 Tax=Zooxanthella nutricula TaxID=1333877 RepID=A0A7S2MJI6_9DINO
MPRQPGGSGTIFGLELRDVVKLSAGLLLSAAALRQLHKLLRAEAEKPAAPWPKADAAKDLHGKTSALPKEGSPTSGKAVTSASQGQPMQMPRGKVDSPRHVAPEWTDVPLLGPPEGLAHTVQNIPSGGAVQKIPSGGLPAAAHSSDAPQLCEEAGRTTIMLRQLPRGLSRDVLVHTLNAMGFAGRYDLAYLPVSFSTGMGLGYAFVNLVSPSHVPAVWAALDGFAQWGGVPCEGTCSVAWSDPNQGLASFVERYRNSPVLHMDVPDLWKPALYGVQGVRLAFPQPTRQVKAPKVRTKRVAK